MPLDRFVLILVCVVAGAAITLWLGVLLAATFTVPFGFVALIPAALVAYVVVRVIGQRVGNPTEDHYDKMDH